MPFVSKAQERYMFTKKPTLAKEFAAKTPSIKALPEKKYTEKHVRGKIAKAAGNMLFSKRSA